MSRKHRRYKIDFLPVKKKKIISMIFYKCPALTLHRCFWQIIQARKCKDNKNLILIYPFHTSKIWNSRCNADTVDSLTFCSCHWKTENLNVNINYLINMQMLWKLQIWCFLFHRRVDTSKGSKIHHLLLFSVCSFMIAM